MKCLAKVALKVNLNKFQDSFEFYFCQWKKIQEIMNANGLFKCQDKFAIPKYSNTTTTVYFLQ
jgi:hypothetical protein